MHFTFTGKEIGITSEDYIIVEAIDSISLVVGNDSIVITKDGIKIYGTSKITKSLTVDKVKAKEIDAPDWDG